MKQQQKLAVKLSQIEEELKSKGTLKQGKQLIQEATTLLEANSFANQRDLMRLIDSNSIQMSSNMVSGLNKKLSQNLQKLELFFAKPVKMIASDLATLETISSNLH